MSKWLRGAWLVAGVKPHVLYTVLLKNMLKRLFIVFSTLASESILTAADSWRRHGREALSIMSPIDYCFNILETLPNLLTVLSSESRKQIPFSLLATHLFSSSLERVNGGLSTSESCCCSPSRMRQQIEGREGVSVQFLWDVTLQEDNLLSPPLTLTIDGSKHSCHPFFVFSIACTLFLFYCICRDTSSVTLYCRNSYYLLT